MLPNDIEAPNYDLNDLTYRDKFVIWILFTVARIVASGNETLVSELESLNKHARFGGR